MLLRSSNNKFSLTSRTFRKILTVCGRPVFCNSVIRVLLPFSLNQFLDFMGLLLGHLSLMIQHWLSCSISFSTFVPNLGTVLFFLILCYPLFDHKGKQNLLSGKDFFFCFCITMTPGYLPHISWSVCYVKFHNILHLSFSICTSGFCLYLSHFLYIFPTGSLFQSNHVVFILFFGLTCCIQLTYDLNSF